MNNTSNHSGRDFLLGTMIGGLAGAAVALLLAPKSGKSLRKDLSQQCDNVFENVGDFCEGTAHWMKDKAQRAGDAASETADHAKNLAKKGKEVLEDTKEKVTK